MSEFQAYQRGLLDARDAIEAGIGKAEAERTDLGMPDVANKGRVITGLKIARGLVIALLRGDRPYGVGYPPPPTTPEESGQQIRAAMVRTKHVLDALAKHDSGRKGDATDEPT